MRNRKMKLKIFVVTIIMLCATINLFAQNETFKMSKDEAAIRANIKQMETGWNAHDSKAFSAPFAADADYVVVNGMYVKGRDEIEKGHTGIFTTIYKDSRNVGTIRNVRFLRKDVAVVHTEWNLVFTLGGETRKGHALSTMIMTKDKGKWSIAAFQNTPIQPREGN